MTRPYLSVRATVCTATGRPSLHLSLEDDQPGLVRIEEDTDLVTTGSVLVNTDEIPALIEALREMQRADTRARREVAACAKE